MGSAAVYLPNFKLPLVEPKIMFPKLQPKTQLIGLTGYAGSGKDLIAAMMRLRGYQRHGFADQVRKEIKDCREMPLMPQHILEDFIEGSKVENWLWAKPTSPECRRVLQWWGTEYRRAQDPDYWVNYLFRHVSLEGPVVISDVRFLNEAKRIRQEGGQLWRVHRPGYKSDGHKSEKELEQIRPDYEIYNDGDLQDLAKQVIVGLETSWLV